MVEIKPAPRIAVRGALVAPSMTKELQWVKYAELYIVKDIIADDYWDKNTIADEGNGKDESIDSSS